MLKQTLIGYTARLTGLNRILTGRLRHSQSAVIVIAYHKIIPDALSHQHGRKPTCDDLTAITLSAAELDAQIAWLTDNFSIIGLDDILKPSGRLPAVSVMLTFDDGFKDVHSTAYPILSRYDCPATLFLTGRHINEKKCTWITELHHVMDNRRADRYQCPVEGIMFELGSTKEINRCLEHVKSMIKRSENFYQTLDRLLEDFQVQLDVTIPESLADDVYLSDNEINTLADAGWTIGNHTYSHSFLPSLSMNDVAAEIKKTSAALNRFSAFRPALAIPFGLGDSYNEAIIRTAFKQDVDVVFTCEGVVNRQSTEPGVLHRVIGESSLDYFKFKVNGGKALARFWKRTG